MFGAGAQWQFACIRKHPGHSPFLAQAAAKVNLRGAGAGLGAAFCVAGLGDLGVIV